MIGERWVGEVTAHWWGEAPEQLYDSDEAAGPLSLNVWLHQYARRAAGYGVNTVKRFVPTDPADHFRHKP